MSFSESYPEIEFRGSEGHKIARAGSVSARSSAIVNWNLVPKRGSRLAHSGAL
jgi:hypothetical protein